MRKIKGDQIKEDEMGGTSSTYMKDEKVIQKFSLETLNDETIWQL